MTQDEQAQIIGNKVLRLQELTREKSCLKSKAEDLIKDIQAIGGLLTDDRSGTYHSVEDNFLFNDVAGFPGFTKPTRWPSQNQVAELVTNLQQVEKEISEIKKQYGDLLKGE